MDIARLRAITANTGADEINFAAIAPKTLKAATVFLSMIPVLFMYVPLQRYFTQGVVLGSVKG